MELPAKTNSETLRETGLECYVDVEARQTIVGTQPRWRHITHMGRMGQHSQIHAIQAYTMPSPSIVMLAIDGSSCQDQL